MFFHCSTSQLMRNTRARRTYLRKMKRVPLLGVSLLKLNSARSASTLELLIGIPLRSNMLERSRDVATTKFPLANDPSLPNLLDGTRYGSGLFSGYVRIPSALIRSHSSSSPRKLSIVGAAFGCHRSNASAVWAYSSPSMLSKL